MIRRCMCTVLIGFFALSLFGCGTIPEEHKGAAVGAGAGAAAGTAAGAVFGDDAKGAVIGGLLGALAGGAIGHYGYDKRRNREETAQTYDYASSQGSVVTIEQVSVSPQQANAGEVVDLDMTYAVLTPQDKAQTEINETRTITYQGDMVGKPTKKSLRPDGTYATSQPLHLPDQAGTGTYKVTFKVETGFGSDTRTATFEVQ